MHTVQQLREQGNKVRVIHYRYPEPPTDNKSVFELPELVPQRVARERHIPLSPRGGHTEVYITTSSNEQFSGIARCNPQDQFNRKIALKIAIGRALKGQNLG